MLYCTSTTVQHNNLHKIASMYQKTFDRFFPGPQFGNEDDDSKSSSSPRMVTVDTPVYSERTLALTSVLVGLTCLSLALLVGYVIPRRASPLNKDRTIMLIDTTTLPFCGPSSNSTNPAPPTLATMPPQLRHFSTLASAQFSHSHPTP